jgi:hypothetical protein
MTCPAAIRYRHSTAAICPAAPPPAGGHHDLARRDPLPAFNRRNLPGH